MSNSPKLKARYVPCLLLALVACSWYFSGNTASTISGSQETQQAGRLLRVETEPLRPVEGVGPVELKCEDAELSAPDSLQKLSCVIRNGTRKNISAVTVTISFLVEQDGRPSVDSSYLTVQKSVHPDFREEYKSDLVPAGGEASFEDLPTDFEGAVIKRIKVQFDYVEFADNSPALGPNRAGARIISNYRKGAKKYKEWLVQEYDQTGKSTDAIIRLLEKDEAIAPAAGVENGEQEQGAILYRNFVFRIYRSKGAEGLKKYLDQNAPVN
jgi:hypothetical protein